MDIRACSIYGTWTSLASLVRCYNLVPWTVRFQIPYPERLIETQRQRCISCTTCAIIRVGLREFLLTINLFPQTHLVLPLLGLHGVSEAYHSIAWNNQGLKAFFTSHNSNPFTLYLKIIGKRSENVTGI